MSKRARRAKSPTPSDIAERIRHQAYLFWLEDGQPEGRAEEHWERARHAVELSDRELGGRVLEKKKSTTKKKHQRSGAVKEKSEAAMQSAKRDLHSSLSNLLHVRFAKLMGRLGGTRAARRSIPSTHSSNPGPTNDEKARDKHE